MSERKDWRGEIRPLLRDKGQQVSRFLGKGKRILTDTFEHAITSTGRRFATVGELVISYPVRRMDGTLISRYETRGVGLSHLEKDLRIGTKETVGRERIGLPIYVTMPLQKRPDLESRAERVVNLKVGRVPKGPNSVVKENNGTSVGKSRFTEMVGVLVIDPVTPESTYLHQMRFGIAVTDPKDVRTLHVIKDISLITSASFPRDEEKKGIRWESVTAGNIAEKLMQWVRDNSDFDIRRDFVLDALRVAAFLNSGVEDFWKTLHARHHFDLLRRLHPNVVTLAMETFITSNMPKEAIFGLNDFFRGIGQYGDWDEFVAAAREAVAQLPEGTHLSINLGLGAINHLLLATMSTVVNTDQAVRIFRKVTGTNGEDDEGDAQEGDDSLTDKILYPLQQSDPLAVLFMSPRFITQFIQFAVERYIPLIEETNEALLIATEEGLKTQKLAAEVLRDFFITIQEGLEKKLPSIRKQLRQEGGKVAIQIADEVANLLNSAADQAWRGVRSEVKEPSLLNAPKKTATLD